MARHHHIKDDLRDLLLLSDINQIEKIETVDWNRDEDLINYDNKHFRKITILLYLYHGIRIVKLNEQKGLICIICNRKLVTFRSADRHIDEDHRNFCKILRETRFKPIVGLDRIEEYYSETKPNCIVEYKCQVCSLSLPRGSIFWHVISDYHKEQFFREECPNRTILQMDDLKRKREIIEQQLLTIEQKTNGGDRGYFKRKPFRYGMVSSVLGMKSELNISYMKSLFPSEAGRLALFTNRSRQMKSKMKPFKNLDLIIDNNVKIHIDNELEYEDGKCLIEKINQAIVEWSTMEYKK